MNSLSKYIKDQEKIMTEHTNEKLGNIIAKLNSDDVDEYDVNDLFDKTIAIVSENEDIDCDYNTPIMDNDVQNAQELIDTYESDLGALDELGVGEHDKVTPRIAEKAGDIGTESVESRENHLAFVNNSFLRGLNWYIADDDGVRLLDAKTASRMVSDMKNDFVIMIDPTELV